METKKQDMQSLIGRSLRFGVTLACLIALAGGLYYILRHGSEAIPDYKHFDPNNIPQSYTTLNGICNGLLSTSATEWIQLGVIILIVTPIFRIVLSLVEYLGQRDWLYVIITLIVLLVIIFNSIDGVG